MFRKEAIEARSKGWSGQAILLSGVRGSYIVAFTLTFFIIFFCFLIFGNYTRRINVSGEIVSSPRAVNVFSSSQGFITRINIQRGEKVSIGQPLYNINVSHVTTSGAVNEKKRKSLLNQLNDLNKIYERIKNNKAATIELLNTQKNRYEIAKDSSTAILEKAKEGLNVMQSNMDNYRQYQREGLINKDQLTNQTTIYYQQQNNMLGIMSQNEQNDLQVLTLENQIRTQSADYDNQLYQIEIQKSALETQIIDVEADGEIIVTSPVNGHIDTLNVTLGQTVAPGDSLAQIIPGDMESWELILWVPDSAVPWLTINKTVNIRYDALPSSKFGQFPGKIKSIAHSPASPREMITYPSSPMNNDSNIKTWYKVVVIPKVSKFSYKGRLIPVENGMKATVTLFIDDRRLYQWILAPLYDVRDSAQGAVND